MTVQVKLEANTTLKVAANDSAENLLQFGEQPLSEPWCQMQSIPLSNATIKIRRIELLTIFNMKSTIQKIIILTLKSYYQHQKAFLKIQRAYYK